MEVKSLTYAGFYLIGLRCWAYLVIPCKQDNECCLEDKIIFLDDWILGGYGESNSDLLDLIKEVMYKEGMFLDVTYTGKAFYGMHSFLKDNKIRQKNILFLHTGGLPLFFDHISLFLSR